MRTKPILLLMAVILLGFGCEQASNSRQGGEPRPEPSISTDDGYSQSISFIKARFLGITEDGKRAKYQLELASDKPVQTFKGLLEFLDSSGRRKLGIMIPYDSGITFEGANLYTGETKELWTPSEREFVEYAGKDPSRIRMRFAVWHAVFKDGSEFVWPKSAKEKRTPTK